MKTSAPEPCELLTWDTDFFHCRIARVRGDALTPEQAAQVDDWCRNNRIRGLYFLCRADDSESVRTAEQHGFGRVDARVTLEHKELNSFTATLADSTAGVGIRPVQPEDLPDLQAIARTAHTNTRFFNDSHFPRERAEELYATWIIAEVQGRAQLVLVAVSANKPLGYISCHLHRENNEGQIGLVGVSQESRGKGIGKKLVQDALEWFQKQNAQKAMVVTQDNNRAAQRLYQQCGFLIQKSEFWYHKWYPVSD